MTAPRILIGLDAAIAFERLSATDPWRTLISSARLYFPAGLVPLLAERTDRAQVRAFRQAVALVPTRAADLAGDGDPTSLALAAADRVRADLVLTGERSTPDPRLCDPGAPDLLEALDRALACRPLDPGGLAEQQADLLPEIDGRMDAVLKHGQFIMGPEVRVLESGLAGTIGRRHAISVASGTMALEIALRALGIGPGDEVVTTPFTWIASAEVIALVGATPVFADIEADGYCLDPERVAEAITPRTRAVIPVGIFGQTARMEAFDELCRPRGIAVIEDAAQSLGATRLGRASGAWGTVSCTSFFPSKPLGAYGDGGLILTDDDALAARCRAIRTHGGEVRHRHELVGTNGRMDTLQAAIVLAKLPTFRDEIERRNRLAAIYDALAPAGFRPPVIAPGNTHAWAQYTLQADSAELRTDGIARLRAAGIQHGIFYPTPLHLQPVFRSLAGGRPLPASELAAARVLQLPMHPSVTPEQAQRIIGSLGPPGHAP